MLTLNLTLLMGRSSESVIVNPAAIFAGDRGHAYGIYCHRSDTELLCEVDGKSVTAFLRSRFLCAVPCSALLDFSNV